MPVEIRGERVRRGKARPLVVDAGHLSQAKPESVPGWAASIAELFPASPAREGTAVRTLCLLRVAPVWD